MQMVTTATPTPPRPSDEEEWKEAAEDVPADSVNHLEGRIFPLGLEALLKKQAIEFHAEFAKMETKIHRLPPILRGQHPRYVVPTAVAIGTYHRSLPHLKEMGT